MEIAKANEFEEARHLLNKLWTMYVEEHELNVPKMEPTVRIQDFFLYIMKKRSTYCYIHYRDEIVTREGMVCFECKHSYPNGEAIKKAYRSLMQELPQEQLLPPIIVILKGDTVDDIGFCPLCLHDW